jgi:Transposase, Mutator family
VRWAKLFSIVPPLAHTRDLLGRMVAWRIQENLHGGHDEATLKLLDGLARGEVNKRPPYRGFGDRAAVAGRLRRLAERRPLGAAICVRVGGRERRMHAGADRRHPRRPRRNSSASRPGCGRGAQSWRELLIDIKRRGLEIAPGLARRRRAWLLEGDRGGFPSTKHQRCWVHKTANVLNKVALSVQVNVKADFRKIYGASTSAAAEAAIDMFADKYGAKYEKAVTCPSKDREALLAFFDFPAEHWDHLRTSSPIDGVFATVRHRTVRTKGSLSATAKLMVFKLVTAASKTWPRLKGENQLPKVVRGVRFQNGIEVIEMPAHHAA